MDVPGRIETVEQLAAHFRPPTERVLGKCLDAINAPMAAYIDHVSFVVLATSDGSGSVDASPRGGPAGFVRRLDDRHVAIPDLIGNNRIDSYRNIVRHPYVGLLLIVPGRDETVRINGPAVLTDDPGLLAGFTKELRPPKLALVIETAEVLAHCAKAFRRSGIWEPDTWAAGAAAPDLTQMYEREWGLDKDEFRDHLRHQYHTDLANERSTST